MFFENRPKWLQSNPHMPKVIPKCASDSTVIPKWPSARSLGAGFNSPVASLISNISHKNVYFLFMGPFGSDTRRQATPKLPQMIQSHAHIPQVTPKWPPNAPKMAPSWPQSYIKSLKSIWENDCFLKTDQSDSKATLICQKWSQCAQVTPQWPQNDPRLAPSEPVLTPPWLLW